MTTDGLHSMSGNLDAWGFFIAWLAGQAVYFGAKANGEKWNAHFWMLTSWLWLAAAVFSDVRVFLGFQP